MEPQTHPKLSKQRGANKAGQKACRKQKKKEAKLEVGRAQCAWPALASSKLMRLTRLFAIALITALGRFLVQLGVAWRFLAVPQSSLSFGGGGKRGKVEPTMAPESTPDGANLAQGRGSAKGPRNSTKI